MSQTIPREIDLSSPYAGPVRWRKVAVLLTFAIVVRGVLLAILFQVTHGKEFADDFAAYRVFLEHPLILITGDHIQDTPDAVIYSPLIPLQVWFPGKFISHFTGTFLGQRIGMIIYDSIAMGVTAWAMVRSHSHYWDRGTWLAAMLLMCVPGSIGAAVLWGQEDSIAAMWTSFATVALATGHPTYSSLFGSLGLFTHKLFALLLSWGIFVTSRKSRVKIAITTTVITVAFFVFLIVRQHYTGMSPLGYSYDTIENSPSPWSLIDRFLGGGKIKFAEIRLYVMAVAGLAVLAVSVPLFRSKANHEASIVATHATFFITFIGVQPEHHQWFMPFLILFAWRQFLVRDWLTFALAWSFSGFAYGYKIAYGLQNRASMQSQGKDVFRSWLGPNAFEHLSTIQLGFHLMFLAVGAALVYRAVTSGARAMIKPA